MICLMVFSARLSPNVIVPQVTNRVQFAYFPLHSDDTRCIRMLHSINKHCLFKAINQINKLKKRTTSSNKPVTTMEQYDYGIVRLWNLPEVPNLLSSPRSKSKQEVRMCTTRDRQITTAQNSPSGRSPVLSSGPSTSRCSPRCRPLTYCGRQRPQKKVKRSPSALTYLTGRSTVRGQRLPEEPGLMAGAALLQGSPSVSLQLFDPLLLLLRSLYVSLLQQPAHRDARG